MKTSGGRMSTVIDGRPYSARGEITLGISNIKSEVASNQDGTNYRTVQAKPRTAELTFDRWLRDTNGDPLRWDENLLKLENIAITFIEDDTGIIHSLTNGCFTGDPQHNTATGEVSGLGVAADSYQMLN